MNFDVLKDVGLVPDHFETARLSGFDLRIEPLANLIRSDPHRVYGVLATATHGRDSRWEMATGALLFVAWNGNATGRQ